MNKNDEHECARDSRKELLSKKLNLRRSSELTLGIIYLGFIQLASHNLQNAFVVATG